MQCWIYMVECLGRSFNELSDSMLTGLFLHRLGNNVREETMTGCSSTTNVRQPDHLLGSLVHRRTVSKKRILPPNIWFRSKRVDELIERLASNLPKRLW